MFPSCSIHFRHFLTVAAATKANKIYTLAKTIVRFIVYSPSERRVALRSLLHIRGGVRPIREISK